MTEAIDETSHDDDTSFDSLLDPEVQDDPYPLYAELHERCPVHRMPEDGTYVLTRYDDVRAAATDPTRFSSARAARRGAPSPAARAYGARMAEGGWRRADTLQRLDPPAHTRYRRLLSRAFTPKRVAALSPRITTIAHDLLDRLAPQGRCEFVADFALPLPGIVIAEQLGLDQDRLTTFKRWADAMLILAQRPQLDVDGALEWAEIELEAQHHLATEFEARRAEPRDDLISVLVHAHVDDDETPLTTEELQDLMHQLVTGGFETTTTALAHGLWLLLTHPDQMALLRERPELLDNFVEEVLRIESPVQGLWRETACPVQMSGRDIDEGEVVMLRFGAANRDAAVFEDPGRFDITRDNAGQHVAFGMGPHFCVGAALAREEMRVAFRAILERLDDIELDGELPTPAHEPSAFLRPMRELPVRYRAATSTP